MVGYYSNVDEARVASDKAHIKRYLQFGVYAKRLNNENMRGEYMKEMQQELTSIQAATREMVPMWFLMRDEATVEDNTTVDDNNEFEFTHEEIMEILDSFDEMWPI